TLTYLTLLVAPLSTSPHLLIAPPPLHTTLHSFFFFLRTRPPPKSPLFPYTTLFRSARDQMMAAPGMMSPAMMACGISGRSPRTRSEEHTSELQSLTNLVCRLLLEKKKQRKTTHDPPPRRQLLADKRSKLSRNLHVHH